MERSVCNCLYVFMFLMFSERVATVSLICTPDLFTILHFSRHSTSICTTNKTGNSLRMTEFKTNTKRKNKKSAVDNNVKPLTKVVT